MMQFLKNVSSFSKRRKISKITKSPLSISRSSDIFCVIKEYLRNLLDNPSQIYIFPGESSFSSPHADRELIMHFCDCRGVSLGEIFICDISFARSCAVDNLLDSTCSYLRFYFEFVLNRTLHSTDLSASLAGAFL